VWAAKKSAMVRAKNSNGSYKKQQRFVQKTAMRRGEACGALLLL